MSPLIPVEDVLALRRLASSLQVLADRLSGQLPPVPDNATSKTAHHDQLTTEEACAFLRVGKTTLYQLRSKGKIKATRIGKTTRWPLAELRKLLDKNTR